MYWFQPVGGIRPFGAERHPVYIWEDPDGTQIYGFPALDGPDGGAKVAFFRQGGTCDPDHLDRRIHPDEIAAMAEYLRPRIPTLPAATSRPRPVCMPTPRTSTSSWRNTPSIRR